MGRTFALHVANQGSHMALNASGVIPEVLNWE